MLEDPGESRRRGTGGIPPKPDNLGNHLLSIERGASRRPASGSRSKVENARTQDHLTPAKNVRQDVIRLKE